MSRTVAEQLFCPGTKTNEAKNNMCIRRGVVVALHARALCVSSIFGVPDPGIGLSLPILLVWGGDKLTKPNTVETAYKVTGYKVKSLIK